MEICRVCKDEKNKSMLLQFTVDGEISYLCFDCNGRGILASAKEAHEEKMEMEALAKMIMASQEMKDG